jgi:Flp pilus assembly protein TadG
MRGGLFRYTGTVHEPRGQSLIELAIVLPVLLVLVIGVVEVADSFNTYITLVDAARDGARLGSKNVATEEEIKALILQETARLRDPIDPDTDITIQNVQVDGVPALRVQVCNNRSLILRIPLILPEGFRMCSTTTMRLLPTS